MWVQDGNSAGCNNGSTLIWEQALTFCEGLNYASYSDWRLPNIRELFSIVKWEASMPRIDGTYFLNTQGGYWTSTTDVPRDTTYAMIVVAQFVGYRSKTNTIYVRPVRGGL